MIVVHLLPRNKAMKRSISVTSSILLNGAPMHLLHRSVAAPCHDRESKQVATTTKTSESDQKSKHWMHESRSGIIRLFNNITHDADLERRWSRWFGNPSQCTTWEIVTTDMPRAWAFLYKPSSTSTLVALHITWKGHIKEHF